MALGKPPMAIGWIVARAQHEPSQLAPEFSTASVLYDVCHLRSPGIYRDKLSTPSLLVVLDALVSVLQPGPQLPKFNLLTEKVLVSAGSLNCMFYTCLHHFWTSKTFSQRWEPENITVVHRNPHQNFQRDSRKRIQDHQNPSCSICFFNLPAVFRKRS